MAAKDQQGQFGVVEYYTDCKSWTGFVKPIGDTREGLAKVLQMMIDDLEKIPETIDLAVQVPELPPDPEGGNLVP